MINLNLNNTYNLNFGQPANIKLPSITVADLQQLQKQSALFPYQEDKSKDSKYLMNKFITKAAIVISTVFSANHLTPKVYKYSRTLGDKLKTGSFKFAIPIAIGVATGGVISSACQLLFNKEIKKDYLISDLKDAFISSSILGSFGILVSTSSKAFGALWQTNSSFIKRCGINGIVGATYAGLRGILKPEKEDQFSVKKIAQGFAEGIFLGEGARLMNKVPTHNLLKKAPEGLNTIISYLKIFTGAALGSMTFKLTDYALINRKELQESKDTQTFFEHLFKGNSYPTLII